MGLFVFGSRILTRVAGLGRAGAVVRGLTALTGDGVRGGGGGSKPAF
jgi:hypothetical protein